MATLENQRHLFDIPADVAYLNCAYMSPLPRAAVRAGQAGVERKAQPWSVSPTDFFTESEIVRGLFARLVHAEAAQIALVPSVSYGIALAARILPLAPGQHVLTLAEQFPSNVYGWMEKARLAGAEHRTVPRPIDDDWTRALLAHVDERTAIVAVPHCHWTDGGLVDLGQVRAACDRVGAALVVDATQSVGALPFDVRMIRPDFLCVAGYKWMMGPYSLGYLYVDPRWHDAEPLEHNWIARERSEDFASLSELRRGFQPGARRFDVGERSNFALVPAARAGLELLLLWGVENTLETLSARTAAIADRARDELGLGSVSPALRAGHFLGLRFDGEVPATLLAELAAEQVHVSVRARALRVTPHLYNTDADVDRLFEVLQRSLRA